MRRELDENGILADAFDLAPRNDDVIRPPQSKNAARATDDQCRDPCILAVKFKVAGISESGAVAKIHNFQLPQLRGTATLHSSKPLSCERSDITVYATAATFLAVR